MRGRKIIWVFSTPRGCTVVECHRPLLDIIDNGNLSNHSTIRSHPHQTTQTANLPHLLFSHLWRTAHIVLIPHSAELLERNLRDLKCDPLVKHCEHDTSEVYAGWTELDMVTTGLWHWRTGLNIRKRHTLYVPSHSWFFYFKTEYWMNRFQQR